MNACAKASVCKALKVHASFASGLTKVLCGTVWMLPSARHLGRLLTATIGALWGANRLMRCPEIVVGLIFNPVRADPLSAITYRALSDQRRLLNKSAYCRGIFFCNLHDILGNRELDIELAQGPAHAFIDYMQL